MSARNDENTGLGHGLRGIIIAEDSGRIRCAGSLAQGWLKKYFSCPNSERRLPLPIRQWLRTAATQRRNLALEKNGDHLVIRLVPGERKGPHCLLLEESIAPRIERKRLTRRETEVLSWLAQGKTNWAIARILDLSPDTVRKHLQHIYGKLGVENRTAAAICAFEILQSMNQGLPGPP